MTDNNIKHKPYADAFLAAWKFHLVGQNKQEYLEYLEKGVPSDEASIACDADTAYINFAHDFIVWYLETILVTKENKDKMITEYGFKKLIDLMCEYNGDEICDIELLDFDEYRDAWLEMLMNNLLNIY